MMGVRAAPVRRTIVRTAACCAVLLVTTVTPTLARTASAAVAPQDANINIVGGGATAAIVCGNVAAAADLANQRHITLQRNNCTAAAAGGSVTLQNVDIYMSSAARASNRHNPLLDAFANARPPGVAEDDCNTHRPPPGPGKQLNKCWAIAHGGRLNLSKVTLAQHASDGRVTSRTIDQLALQPGDSGGADATCTNVVNDPQNQRDDCAAGGGGATWSMHTVDVAIHNPDGTTTMRHGINVDVRGGTAQAGIYCFNVTDGSGRVIQINVCRANADGGDATLHNVTIHTSG